MKFGIVIRRDKPSFWFSLQYVRTYKTKDNKKFGFFCGELLSKSAKVDDTFVQIVEYSFSFNHYMYFEYDSLEELLIAHFQDLI